MTSKERARQEGKLTSGLYILTLSGDPDFCCGTRNLIWGHETSEKIS